MLDVQYNVVSFLSSESHSNVRWEKMRGWDADLNEIFSIIICIRFSLYEIRIHSVRLSIQRGWWDGCDDVHVLGFDVVLVV